MPLTLEAICQIYTLKGNCLYDGEAVSQLEHALQCAALAEAHDQPAEMIAACLLHDLGHLLPDLADAAGSKDNRHEYRALPDLRSLFVPAVTEPIRLHVQAKRYLCAVDPSYQASLSASSQRSLQLQGGGCSQADAQAFITQRYAPAAVQLRRWDDRAKVLGLKTADIHHFVPALVASQG